MCSYCKKKKTVEITQLFANRVRYQIAHRVSASSKHGDHKNTSIESEGRRFSTNALISTFI